MEKRREIQAGMAKGKMQGRMLMVEKSNLPHLLVTPLLSSFLLSSPLPGPGSG